MSYTQLKWLLRSVNLFRPIFPEALFWQEFSFVGSKMFEPKLYAWASSLSLSGSNYGIRTRISRIIQSLPLLTPFWKAARVWTEVKTEVAAVPVDIPTPSLRLFRMNQLFDCHTLDFCFLFFIFELVSSQKCSSCDILSTIKVFRKIIFVCFKLNCSKGECCSSREVLWSSNLQ